jgi:hypothetical protein
MCHCEHSENMCSGIFANILTVITLAHILRVHLRLSEKLQINLRKKDESEDWQDTIKVVVMVCS